MVLDTINKYDYNYTPHPFIYHCYIIKHDSFFQQIFNISIKKRYRYQRNSGIYPTITK